MYDALEPGYTVVRTARQADVRHLAAAAAARHVPLAVVDVPDLGPVIAHPPAFVLVRPDHHVAWRGNDAGAGAQALLDRITGR